jgi:hypothetical protein
MPSWHEQGQLCIYLCTAYLKILSVLQTVTECYKDWRKLHGCDGGGGIVEGMNRGLILCTAVELAWMN